MQEELFKEFKESVEKKKQEAGYHNARIEAAKMMESDQRIQTYLSLCGVKSAIKSGHINFDINKEFDKFIGRINPEDTNKIYICYGTFSEIGEFDNVTMEYRIIEKRVNRDSADASFRYYWDIEQREPIKVPIEECEEFEKVNIVLPIHPSSIKAVRKEFLTRAVEVGQEESTKELCKRYNIKK